MPFKPTIPDEYLRAIGLVTVEWDRMEQVLNFLLIKLLGTGMFEIPSQVIFAHMTFPQKLDILSALVEALPEFPRRSLVTRYKTAVYPLLTSAQKMRNRIVHASWAMKEGKVTITSISARGKFKIEVRYVPLKEVEDASSKIMTACETLYAMTLELPDSNSQQSGQ